MTWLTPMAGLIAAAVTVPLLVGLYYLKLRRTEREVPSTFLWQRAVKDLQVNAPFRRLRKNLLLLLQLLVLGALLLAVAQPGLRTRTGPGRRVVLMMDRSASMRTTDGPGGSSRLDEAKRRALALIDALRQPGAFSLNDSGDRAMVIAFDDHARVLCPLTGDRRRLRAAVESIRPGDGGTNPAEAFVAARAMTQQPGGGRASAEAVLFSDGKLAGKPDVPAGLEMLFVPLGRTGANVAVADVQARRAQADPAAVEVFARLTNHGPERVTADVQLSADDAIRSVKRVTIPPAGESGPGAVAVSYALRQAGPAELEVRCVHEDPLQRDNAAWWLLPAPRELRGLLVTDRPDGPVGMALRACGLRSLGVMSPAEFDAEDHDRLSVTQPWDVIVLDGHTPARCPTGRYLVFAPPPPASGAEAAGELKDQPVLDWRSRHAVLRHVSLGEVFAARAWKLKLPARAEVLAEFPDGPGLAVVRNGRSVFLLAGFDPLESNWPFQPGFVMAVLNAVNYLGRDVGGTQRRQLAVGEPIVLASLPGGAEAAVDTPDGSRQTLRVGQDGLLRFAGTDAAGIYEVRVGELPPRRFAVNLADPSESDIAPAAMLRLAGRAVAGGEGTPEQTPTPLWGYLALAGLGLLCLEWVVYNSRARL